MRPTPLPGAKWEHVHKSRTQPSLAETEVLSARPYELFARAQPNPGNDLSMIYIAFHTWAMSYVSTVRVDTVDVAAVAGCGLAPYSPISMDIPNFSERLMSD